MSEVANKLVNKPTTAGDRGKKEIVGARRRAINCLLGDVLVAGLADEGEGEQEYVGAAVAQRA